jgi:transposase-like protein
MALPESSTTPASTQNVSSENQPSAAERTARRSPRRVLSEDQKREVVRLYVETTTSVPEIREQFGIAESSLYRLLQQRGVAPRGRVPVARIADRSVLEAAPPMTVPNGRVARRRQVVRPRTGGSRQRTSRLSPSSALGIEYRVSFTAVQIVTAVDIVDALRQAAELGATEITEIIRSE